MQSAAENCQELSIDSMRRSEDSKQLNWINILKLKV